MDTATLYKLIDLLRGVASVFVGLCAYLLSANDVLHLPAWATGALTFVAVLASHYGIRQYTTPAPASTVGRKSINEDWEPESQ